MTCYLNSLLQALYMTPEFRNALYNWENKKNSEKVSNTSIPFQLQKLFLNLQTSNKNAVETTSLTKSFGWDSNEAWQQHDIQELCRVMFDALEQNFKNTTQADLINRLYEGKIKDYVKCLTCNTEKSREDTFLDIPLPVRPFDNTVAYGSVVEALEAFVKYETLEGNNQYFCEKCNKKSDAHKGLKFIKFPYILTLQLKRFDFDQNAFHRIKLNDKVTFPDILNLNSFIKPTNRVSLALDEDSGMGVEDSGTTDGVPQDEGCDALSLTGNYLSSLGQHDDDQDEGVDLRNGTLTESTYNFFSEKRKKYAQAKGPYIYDLFSVMIHSGSASGGHYYAYIKDFRNNKWLCFNDQSVSPITQEDIQRSYGGGTRVGCYGGAYRSSTNAYMLMYRQIDPERNSLPMDSKDFPSHIKDLLENIKKNEEDRSYHEEMESKDRQLKQNIYYRHPSTHNIEQVSILINKNYTLAEIAESTYRKAQLDDLLDLDQCRIVHYYVKYDLIDCTYDQTIKFENIFLSKPLCNKELFLDIRGKYEKFENFPSKTIITKVYVIDASGKELIEPPKYVRAYRDQSIKEYKQELKKHFNVDPNHLYLLGKEILPKKILDDDYKFESDLSLRYPYKIYVTEMDLTTLQDIADSSFYEFSEDIDLTKTFFIDPNIIVQDSKGRFNVPPLNSFYEDEKVSENIYNHCSESADNQVCSAASSVFDYASNITKEKHPEPFIKLFSKSIEQRQNVINSDEIFAASNKVEKWACQESSNSEDSSLSDSDRTLVGDAPEEPGNESEGAIIHAESKNDEKFFKLFQLKRPNLWKVTIDETMTEEELKKKLEIYINIPKYFFKLVDLSVDECHLFSALEKFKDDQKYSICLERVIQPDEVKMDIYMLKMDSPDPLQKLFTVILKKNILIGAAKQEILDQLKRDNNLELPHKRWSFMECSEDWVGITLADNEKPLPPVYKAICIQELPDENLLAGQSIVYVRKWELSEMHLHDPQSIHISLDDFSHQLKKKVTLLSNIPYNDLEFTTMDVKKKYSFFQLDNYQWKSEIKLEEVDSKTYILFRDFKERNGKLSGPNNEISGYQRSIQKEQRTSGLLPTSVSCSRKEKGLKIHVDSS